MSKVGKARGSVKHGISSSKNLSKSLNDISLTDKTLILISKDIEKTSKFLSNLGFKSNYGNK